MTAKKGCFFSVSKLMDHKGIIRNEASALTDLSDVVRQLSFLYDVENDERFITLKNKVGKLSEYAAQKGKMIQMMIDCSEEISADSTAILNKASDKAGEFYKFRATK